MVSGIETFKDWFQGYSTRYVIIGGTACNLIYSEYGAPERATRDIDMIVVAEAFDREFYARFVEFVRTGGYQHKNKASEYELYRFERPADVSFPPKIELLSRRPECLEGIETELGRFQTVDASGSLSAILLDDDYYDLVEKGVTEIGGLPVLSLHYLPVFKIHAWANLSDSKAAGKHSRDSAFLKIEKISVLGNWALLSLRPPNRELYSLKEFTESGGALGSPWGHRLRVVFS